MARKKKIGSGYAFNACSLCEHITVTVGEQDFGGIRYCKDCITGTLAWVQWSDEERAKIMEHFAANLSNPMVIAQVAILGRMSAAELAAHEKKISVMEASHRVMQQNIREARGY